MTTNVWGWLHLYGLGELTEIHGRFTADQYLEILEEVMLPSVRAMALPYPERIVFMQVDELILFLLYVMLQDLVCMKHLFCTWFTEFGAYKLLRVYDVVVAFCFI